MIWSLLTSYDAVVSGDFNVYGTLKGGISFPSLKYEDLLLCLWPWKMNFSGVHNHIFYLCMCLYSDSVHNVGGYLYSDSMHNHIFIRVCGRLPVLWQWAGLSGCGRGLFDFRTVFYFVLIRCKSSHNWIIWGISCSILSSHFYGCKAFKPLVLRIFFFLTGSVS